MTETHQDYQLFIFLFNTFIMDKNTFNVDTEFRSNLIRFGDNVKCSVSGWVLWSDGPQWLEPHSLGPGSPPPSASLLLSLHHHGGVHALTAGGQPVQPGLLLLHPLLHRAARHTHPTTHCILNSVQWNSRMPHTSYSTLHLATHILQCNTDKLLQCILRYIHD